MTFFRLDKPVQFLKGVGPNRSESLGRMGIVTARDLLYHGPRRYDDASTIQPIVNLEVGSEVSVIGSVRSKGVISTRTGLRIFQAVLQDDSGMITCAWPGQPWIERRLQVGDVVLATGPVKFFHGPQLQPREFIVVDRSGSKDVREGLSTSHIFVSYPASEEIQQWVLRSIFEKNLDSLLNAIAEEEYLRPSDRKELSLLGMGEALEALHRPDSMDKVEQGRRRLAFDELFFLQTLYALGRYRQTESKLGISFQRDNTLIGPLHDSLPFDLTEGQVNVLREIFEDMNSPRRMNRLLQGDVGSGKTIVCLFAMLLAVEGGYQTALMAPTELLAEQHASTLEKFLKPLGIEVYLLTGKKSDGDKNIVLQGMKDGQARITVGTHALIQEGVTFEKLGLVVVDEQHRFGVKQRMALGDSEIAPDTLLMSATPIPRSLAMAMYGDFDLSIIEGLPSGRVPVSTLLYPSSKRGEVYDKMESELEGGSQAYIVYPLIDDSDKIDLRSAKEGYEKLCQEVFPKRKIGLVHGQLASEERDEIMQSFISGETEILVATTVIEVGIDVANATVMLIEHPERFGLSQLHQLRGRVGRGSAESFCMLISDPQGVAAERIRVFMGTTDGFALAKEDLRIRGQGDFFGAQQHGRDPALKFADLARDEDLLVEAQYRARLLIQDDPELGSKKAERVKDLLTSRYSERLRLFSVG
ncbi:MAG: ATP-dependent DNA helicase RecG [Gemmatimonadetes bacterium]|nr:ATP-dependent DNA helicase RecG [Gemmatimonadota bacterium]